MTMRRGWTTAVSCCAVTCLVLPLATLNRASMVAGSPARLGSVLARGRAPPGPTWASAVVALGGRVGPALPVVNGFAAQVPPGAIARLRTAGALVDGDAGVRLAGFYGAGSGGASAVFPDATHASAAWAAGYDGTGTTVAVLDTGIDPSGDLAGKVAAAADLWGAG